MKMLLANPRTGHLQPRRSQAPDEPAQAAAPSGKRKTLFLNFLVTIQSFMTKLREGQDHHTVII